MVRLDEKIEKLMSGIKALKDSQVSGVRFISNDDLMELLVNHKQVLSLNSFIDSVESTLDTKKMVKDELSTFKLEDKTGTAIAPSRQQRNAVFEILRWIKSERSISISDYIGNKNQINMKEFIEYFNLNAGTATRVIDQLVKKNFIIRESMDGDRRKVGLKLSEFGLYIYSKLKEIEKGEIKKVLDVLSDDDIENLIRILKKINKIFE